MTDTTNTEPPLRAAFEAWAAKDEPPYKLERAPDPFIYAWGSTACAWKAFEAGAAHAVAQRQGEPAAWLYDTDMADLAAGKNARVYPVDAKPHYKDTDRVVRFYTAPATAEQPAEPTDVDWRGLALDLEARAKTVESQTTERAMLAAAHGLRLIGPAAATAPAPVAQAREITDAEIDALRKDAERYRVLRNRDHGFIVEQERPGWVTTLPIGKGLDAAIDAAIALANGSGTEGRCPACGGTGLIQVSDNVGMVDQFACDLCNHEDVES